MFRLIQAPTHATEGTGSYCLSDPFASPCGHQMGQAGGPAIFPHISSTGKKRRWRLSPLPTILFVLIKSKVPSWETWSEGSGANP